jgi:hypothetical protein
VNPTPNETTQPTINNQPDTIDPAISVAITKAELEILSIQARLLMPNPQKESSCARDLSPVGGGFH